MKTFEWPRYLGNTLEKEQSLFYFSSTGKAVHSAIAYSECLPDLDDPELDALAGKIKANVHEDYYLAQLIP